MNRKGMTLTKINKGEKLVPIYSPRSSYKVIREQDQKLLADLTLNFDRFSIDLLKEEFKIRNWQIDLINFICVVKEHLTVWKMELPNRELRLLRCLMLLFKQIDINSNGTLQWDEFTNYIIEKATVLKNLKSKNEEIKSYTKLNIKPKAKFDAPIAKSVYLPDIDKLAIYEQGSNVVMFMDPNTGDFLSKNLVVNPKQLVVNMAVVKKGNQGKLEIKKKDLVISTDTRILDMLYINSQKYKILVTSTSDRFVRGWKYTISGFTLSNLPDSQEEVMEHEFTQEIYSIAWDYLNQILFCGRKDGKISAWNLKSDTEKDLVVDEVTNEKEAHTMMVMNMIAMPKLHFLASGGMDGKLILWDTINNKIKWVYKEHTRGILSLSFNQNLILLFSGGFDHQICIWNPYISTLIHKIQGHLSPILTLTVIQGTNQLISLDEEGTVKISDIRRFNIINSFTVNNLDETQKFKPNSFSIIPKPMKLCLVGRTVTIFQYDKNYNPASADDYTTIACRYIQQDLAFYTASGNKVKIWNALTGDVQRIFLDVSSGQISSFALDFLQKRMIIGDTTGKVVIHNTKNGARLRALPAHTAEITHILTYSIGNDNIFITAGMDNLIKISKQTQQNVDLLRTLQIKKEAAITCLHYCDESHVIVVGTNLGVLGFYDIDTGKMVGSVCEKEGQEITSICKLERAILVTRSNGTISIIAMPPLINKFEKMYGFLHKDPENANVQIEILFSKYSDKHRKFYVVDGKSYLTCYDFTVINSDIQKNIDQQKIHRQANHRRKAHRLDKPSSFSVTICWSIKAHQQVVKDLEYINSDSIIVTSSFDRKIKFWNAITGEFIDSLQQNYDKPQPKPLAFKRRSTGSVYKPNFQEKLHNHKEYQNQQADIYTEFDPYYECNHINLSKIQNQKSNQDWKLEIEFKNHYQRARDQFLNILEQVNKKTTTIVKKAETMHVNPEITLEKLAEKKLFLKQFKQKKTSKHQSIYPDVSFMKQKENTHNKQQNTLKKAKSLLSVKHLLRVKSNQEMEREVQEHSKYIERLHYKELQSKTILTNENKLVVSPQQGKAALRLSQALFNINNYDRRSLGFINNISIRQPKKLPKLI